MGFRWHFNRVKAGEKIREPIHSEFFAAEAIAKPGEALVREGIQNSLDAGQPGSQVTVRIFLSGDVHAAAPRDMNPFMEGLWPHLQADGSGLYEAPSPRDSCPFLVFEDFGTTGLTGDTSQWQPLPGIFNNFFNFHRCDGRSDRNRQELGRWGIGKHVFTRASRIRTFFALTVRADDRRRILLGQAALRSHSLDDVFYSPDGWFGQPPQTGHDGLIRTVEDPLWIKRFEELFDLKRHREPGLSVVIPWYSEELRLESVACAILRHYFWAILRGDLQVCLQNSERSVVFDTQTLNAANLPQEVDTTLGPVVQLARWASTVPDDQRGLLEMPASDQPWVWSADLFGHSVRSTLRGRYEAGEQIALRVPVTVREKGARPRASFFDVFMQRDPSEKTGRPVFIRQGIVIPDIRAPRTYGVRSLVIVNDPPLAGFLGDSENPAHTQWEKESSKFRGKYVSGPGDLTFVVHSVHEINRILRCSDQQADRTLLADLFSLHPSAATAAEESIRPDQNRSAEQLNDGIQLICSRPHGVLVERTQRGFVLRKGDRDFTLPGSLVLTIAYGVRGANAFSNWRPTDFQIDKAPIEIHASGGRILSAAHNRVKVRIDSDQFELKIEGFDRRRDLRIRVIQHGSGIRGNAWSREGLDVSSDD